MDTFSEDFAENDYSNFLTRKSIAMGYDLSKLKGGRVYYKPSLSNGQTELYFRSGKAKIVAGNKNAPWLQTTANAENFLVHEWGHVGQLALGPLGPDNPLYLRELDAIAGQFAHPSWRLVTSEFRGATERYWNKWYEPFLYPHLQSDRHYIYGRNFR